MLNTYFRFFAPIFLLVFFIPVVGISQTTVRYCEEGTKHYTQCWTLTKGSKRKGTFKQIFVQDDRQVWFGLGTYKETRKKLILTYNTSQVPLKSIRVQASPDRVDSVLISWETILGIQDYFQIEYTNQQGEKVFVEPDLTSQKACVYFKNLGSNSLRLLVNGEEITGFQVNVYQTETVHIQANQPSRIHLLENESFEFQKVDGKLVWLESEKEKRASISLD